MKQNWSKIWFTDEKRWCLDDPDRVGHYWHDLRKEPLTKSKRQAGGGSLMIWAAICQNKKTNIYFCNGTLYSVQYQHILATLLKEHIESDEILMQDNAPVH